MMKVLLLGVNGLLGHACFNELINNSNIKVVGTIRNRKDLNLAYFKSQKKNLIVVKNLFKFENLDHLFKKVKPDIVINCVSIEKKYFNDLPKLVEAYSIFPKKLVQVCRSYSARLILFSSDGVFSGKKGNYIESSPADAKNYYGIAKYLGEIESKKCLIIRTSMIGHSIKLNSGLLDWFLSQRVSCNGYGNVYFSGLTNIEIAKIISNTIINNEKLNGIIHISSKPISKYKLLLKLKKIYKRKIKIINDKKICNDLTLNSNKFYKLTGYKAPSWDKMIKEMYEKRNK